MPPSTNRAQKPWYEHLTIDLVVHVLQRTLFHPFVAWMLPLSLRAQATPYAHLSFVLATGYAALITLFSILNAINKRIAYGVPRELNWDDEVVVITGGSSGLGRVIANTYGMRGVTVAVLDVKPFYEMGKEEEDESGQNIKWYECDIGDGDAVRKVKEAIEKDVCSALDTLTHNPQPARILFPCFPMLMRGTVSSAPLPS